MIRKMAVTRRPQFPRLLHDLGVLFVFGVLVTAVVVELPPLDPETPRQGREQESDDLPGGGIITSTHVLQIWLPEPLFDLAKRESRAFVVEKHEELRNILERPEYQDLFYAFMRRGYQVNFGSADITFIRYPLRVHENLQEFLNILATAAGSPPRSPPRTIPGPLSTSCPRDCPGKSYSR